MTEALKDSDKLIFYNVYIGAYWGKANEYGLTIEKLKILVEAYLQGKNSYTISGKTKSLNKIHEFRIFEMTPYIDPNSILEECIHRGFAGKNLMSNGDYFFKPEAFIQLGKEVTENFIGDNGFGDLKVTNLDQKPLDPKMLFINELRISELKKIESDEFDLRRLIQLCEELNSNYKLDCYLSVGMLLRSLIDHIPPIFGFDTFVQFSSNYGTGGKSFKKNMQHLQGSFRNIADGILHSTIMKKESLPTHQQIDFKADIDVLLLEIIKVLS